MRSWDPRRKVLRWCEGVVGACDGDPGRGEGGGRGGQIYGLVSLCRWRLRLSLERMDPIARQLITGPGLGQHTISQGKSGQRVSLGLGA